MRYLPILSFALTCCVATAASAAEGRRVQCWTDNQGHRACGDTVPPQYANKERQVYDDQGRVRAVKPREKTEAEVEAEEQAAREAAEAAQRAQKQRDYDRFLLSTYSSDKDIEQARDERIAMLDGRQKLTEKALADNARAVDQQQARIDNIKSAGKTPPQSLVGKLEELKRNLDANRRALADFGDEKQRIADKYNADLARYRELRRQQAADSPAQAPPPGQY